MFTFAILNVIGLHMASLLQATTSIINTGNISKHFKTKEILTLLRHKSFNRVSRQNMDVMNVVKVRRHEHVVQSSTFHWCLRYVTLELTFSV